MLPRFGLQAARSTQTHAQRNISQFLYKNVWRKSNASYLAYIFAGAVAVEIVYGKGIDAIWNSYNKGKLYKDVDWSQFKTEDD